MMKSKGSMHSAASGLLMVLLALGFPGMGFSLPSVSSGPESLSAASLSVVTDPDGATVYVDGVAKGLTPLEVGPLSSGDHRVTLVKAGYLENSRVLSLEGDQTRTLDVKLTPSSGETRHTIQIRTEEGGDGGGNRRWLYIAGAGGAAAAAVLLLTGRNNSPNAGSITVSPDGPGLAAVTSFSFTSTATDPDDDALTFRWDFGDGGSGSGQTTSHTYSNAGTYTVTVTVSDDKESVTATTSATVKSLTGTWVGNLSGRTQDFFTFTLTQNGTSLTGRYSDTVNGQGTATGSLSAPREISMTNRVSPFRPGSWRGSLSSNLDRIEGTVDWFSGGTQGFFLNRR